MKYLFDRHDPRFMDGRLFKGGGLLGKPGTPDIKAPSPPPSAPEKPPEAVQTETMSPERDASNAKRKGRNSLRVDLGGSVGAGGTGLNIPQA